MTDDSYVIYTEDLTFQYPDQTILGVNEISMKVRKGEKFLLIGPNGAGKSTLLKILAGKKLIKSGKLELYGINPFDLRNNSKLNEKTLIYLGTEWANNEITKRDIKVKELIQSVGGDVFVERRDRLVEILEINYEWRMNRCSDGQRRRVQLCMGLLKPFDILLLDEVTIDLDVLVRDRLLQFLSEETNERGCCVVYATHIFDGLGQWPDQVMHIRDGEIVKQFGKSDIHFGNDSTQGVDENASSINLPLTRSLHPLAVRWLRDDKSVAQHKE